MPACCESPCPRRRRGAARPRWPRWPCSARHSAAASRTPRRSRRACASVSRLGLATEPESRWSRPMTMGACSSPRATISLKARPSRARSASPTQQIRAGRPLKMNSLPRHVEPAMQMGVVGQQFLHLGVGAKMSSGSPEKRDPAKRPDAFAKQRADIGRHEAGEGKGVGHALVLGYLADVVAVVEDGRAAGLHFEHRCDMHGDRLARRPGDRRRVFARAAAGPDRASSRRADSRSKDRGRWSDRSRDRAGCRGGPARAALRRQLPNSPTDTARPRRRLDGRGRAPRPASRSLRRDSRSGCGARSGVGSHSTASIEAPAMVAASG